ncbi:MAG TPA: LamG domain-containing protein, partial [Actinocrinis sp.]
ASVQTGTVQFTAARSGGFMNQAAIEIRPTDVAELCDIGIDDRHGRTAQVTSAQRPRLATYARTGTPDLPDEQVRWAMGLQPAPALGFGNGNGTRITEACSLSGLSCSIQASFFLTGVQGHTWILQLATADDSPYLSLQYSQLDGVLVAEYGFGPGSVRAVSPHRDEWLSWVQATATLETTDTDARVTLYIDGVAVATATGDRLDPTRRPGTVIAGGRVGRPGQPMNANGMFVWSRALTATVVLRLADAAPQPNDDDLVLAWYLTEGAGTQVHNVAVNGTPSVSDIVGTWPNQWATEGVYALPWVANRDYGLCAPSTPLLGGWHHLALAYRTAYGLSLAGADYADCGNDASLDFSSAFSLEACFTPAPTGATQTLISKPGNYELSLTPGGEVQITVPTTNAAAGSIRFASGSRIDFGRPCYVAATVSTGTVQPSSGGSEPAAPEYYVAIDLYVNGQRFSDYTGGLTDPVGIATSEQRLNLGRNTAEAAYFSGLLSDVRLWNRALTQDEVTAVRRSHRIASQLQPAAADTSAPPVVPPAGLEGNTVITRMIEGQITAPVPSTAQIGA